MESSEETGKLAEAVGILFGALAVLFIVSLIPAALWYAFDGTLAELAGVPQIAEVGFWNVYAFCLFVQFLRGAKHKHKAT